MGVAEDVVNLSERTRHLEAMETYDIGSGAPTHYAAEGWKYWDQTNDQLYVNNDGANGWTLIGGGAGGGAAPHEILQTNVHTDSTTANVQRGDLMTGQAAAAGGTAWERLPLGGGNMVLMSDGVDAQWQTPGSWWSGGWVPLGGIILWSGSVATIPFNWQLCDGTNGTPDLRDRFVVGAGASYAVDATGGAASQNLAHTHGPGTLETDSDTHDHDVDAGTTANDSHDHTVDAGVTGAGSAHSHGAGTLNAPASLTAQNDITDAPPNPLVSLATHTHSIAGNTANESAHTHGPGTLETDSDTHSHGPGTLDTDTDTHDHSIDAGVTANALGVTSILPPYYALCYIQRMA